MPWVTFGCAEATGMTVMVGANMKDENYLTECGGLAAGMRATGADRRPLSRRNEAPGRAKAARAGYCLVPVKVPSPNCPSDTLPLMVLPSVLPEYFTATACPCPSTLYSIVTSSPFTVPVTCASPN